MTFSFFLHKLTRGNDNLALKTVIFKLNAKRSKRKAVVVGDKGIGKSSLCENKKEAWSEEVNHLCS